MQDITNKAKDVVNTRIGTDNLESAIRRRINRVIGFPGIDNVDDLHHHNRLFSSNGNPVLVIDKDGEIVYSGFTKGSIPFIGKAGKHKQDNANWFYDETNKRIGVGTNAPQKSVDIIGGLYTRPSSENLNGRIYLTTDNNNSAILGYDTSGNLDLFLSTNPSTDSYLRLGATNLFVWNSSGFGIGIVPDRNFYISDTRPQFRMDVTANNNFGNLQIRNNLGANAYFDFLIYGSAYAGSSFGLTHASRVFMTAAGVNVAGLVIGTQSNSDIDFVRGSTNYWRIGASGHLIALDDNVQTRFGAGSDASITYDGTDMVIDSSLVAASDINITCGSQKTVELQNTVYEDENVGGISLGKGASAPDLVSIGATSIRTYAFDGNAITEELEGCMEVPHSYKEGTDLVFHVHWMPTTNAAGNVKWQLEYEWENFGGTFGGSTTISVVDAAGGTAWVEQRVNIGTISGSGKTIGSQFVFRLFRDPTDGSDTYGDDAAILTVGFHYERNTLGSRQITSK